MPDIAGSFARGRQSTGGGQALMDLISFIAELQLERERFQEQKRHNLALEKSGRIQAEGLASLRGAQAELIRGEIEAGPEPKSPSASDVAFARRRMEKYQTKIDEASARIEQMRQDLKLGPGGHPKTPGGIGRKKEQTNLDNWNKLHSDRTRAQKSLDSLLQASAKRGIDLKFGAPAPEDVSNMTEDEILQMIGAGGR